jgi:hypothetical protein
VKLLRIALLLTVLAACGSDQDPVVGPSSDETTTTRAAGGASSTSTTTEDGAGFATTEVTAEGAGRGLLQTVTATHTADVDRVTFTFEGDLPGYRVGYVERPITEDGSGEEVTVDGGAVLGVRFEPASGFDLTGEGRQVFTGPTRLDLATTAVLDVVRTGDFEAVLQWAIGVDTAGTPFRVRTEGRTIVVEVRATDA